jgi:hypothetical protein
MMKKKSVFLATALSVTILASSAYGDPLNTEAQTYPVTAPAFAQEEAKQNQLEEQLRMLEQAIVPTTPEETIQTWAKSVQLRNGALQYALGTQGLKEGLKTSLEQFHWVTGASSPWVETYKVVNKEEKRDESIEYVVEFDLVTSSGKAGKDQAVLSLIKHGDQWLIRGISPASEKAIGIWNTPESINELHIEKNFEEMNTYQSKLGYSISFSQDMMDKMVIQDATCENEEGNPPCTFFYYKNTSAKKDVLLLSLIRLTKEQEKSSYYQDHPFLKKVGTSEKGSFYLTESSELPYAEVPDSEQGKEWSYLLEALEERIQHLTPAS